MTSASSDPAAPNWRIRRLTQFGKVYVQAVIQPDKPAALYTVGLGYLGADGTLTTRA